MRPIAVLLILCLVPVASSAGLPETIENVRPAIVGVGAMYPPRQPNRKGDPVAYLGTGFVVVTACRSSPMPT